MKLKQLFIVPAVSFMGISSGFSQAVADVPAAEMVNKNAEEFRADKSDSLRAEMKGIVEKLAAESEQEIDFDKMYQVLGLDKIGSYAMSSEKKGEEWLSKIYLHDGGANKGLMKLIGGPTSNYTVTEMSPAGTDLAFQMRVNLGELEELIRGVMVAANMEAGDLEEFDDGMQEDVPMLGISISAMLKKTDINLNMALDLDENEKLQSPVGEIDRPRLVIRIDQIKWALPAIEQGLQDPSLPLKREEKDGIITYTAPEEMMGMMMGYRPVMVMDTKKDQFWIATSPKFLGACKNGEKMLKDDALYQTAIKGLPTEGNMFSFASKHFADVFVEKIEDLVKQGMIPESDDLNDAIKELRLVKTASISTITRDDTGLMVGSLAGKSLSEYIEDMKEDFAKLLEQF